MTVAPPASPTRQAALLTPRTRAPFRALVALFVARAAEGILAKVAIGVAGLTSLGLTAGAWALARDVRAAPLAELSNVGAGALVWGAGVLLAFAAAAHAFRRDRDDGVRALVNRSGAGRLDYLVTRTSGLASLLALVFVGALALPAVAALSFAPSPASARIAALGFGASFATLVIAAAMLAPLSLAALGARSRAGGYLFLLFVLVLPTLLEPLTAELLPLGWDDVTSIPRALSSFRGGVGPEAFDATRALRALVVLSAVGVLSLAVAYEQLARVDREPERDLGRGRLS